MLKKLAMIAAGVVLAVGISLWCQTPAWAACRDDCYSSCCGDGSLCQGDEEMSCLASCLEDCGGDNVPDVPEPTPADGDNDNDQGEQTTN